jgi:hypothetical protein
MEGVFVRTCPPITHIITHSSVAKLKPIEGAESEGALGFFKGVGKGLVGFVFQSVLVFQ